MCAARSKTPHIVYDEMLTSVSAARYHGTTWSPQAMCCSQQIIRTAGSKATVMNQVPISSDVITAVENVGHPSVDQGVQALLLLTSNCAIDVGSVTSQSVHAMVPTLQSLSMFKPDFVCTYVSP